MGQDGQHGTFEGALDVSLELPLAHAGTRAVAQALDLMVVSLLVIVISVVVVGGAIGLAASAVDNDTVLALAVAGMLIFSFLAQWGYFVGCEMLMEGQSPGKAVMGIRVVGQDGAAVGLLASLIRNLLRIVDLFPMTYGVGLLTMMISVRGQRLGDLAAGTLVVHDPPMPRTVPRPTHFPDGFGVDDVALVEDFFARFQELMPEPRRHLAEGLLCWLEATHPGFVEAENHASIEPLSPERRLSDAFATVRTAETLPSVEA